VWHFHNEILPDLYILDLQYVRRVKHILSRLWHVKYHMEICQLRRQSYLVRHRPNPPRDLIRAKELRRELPWADSPSHTSGSGHPQEHTIFSSEFQRSPPTIRISLLPTLRGLYSVPHHFHFLSGLLQQLRFDKHCFPILIPTQRSPTLSAIKSLIWRHANARMKTVVVGELYQR